MSSIALTSQKQPSHFSPLKNSKRPSMNTNPAMLEAAAAHTWTKLVTEKDQTRPWNLVCTKATEIAEAHRKAVKAHFDADFVLDKALLLLSDWKVRKEDYLDRAVKYQERLGDELRMWAKTNAG